MSAKITDEVFSVFSSGEYTLYLVRKEQRVHVVMKFGGAYSCTCVHNLMRHTKCRHIKKVEEYVHKLSEND